MCGNCLICLQRFHSEDSSCAVSSPAAHASARHKVIDTANPRKNVCLCCRSGPAVVEGGSLVQCNSVQQWFYREGLISSCMYVVVYSIVFLSHLL